MQGLVQYLVKLAVEIVELREKGDKQNDNDDDGEEVEVEVQKFHQQLFQMQGDQGNNNNQQLQNVQDDDEEDEDDEDYEENVEFKSKVILSYSSPLENFDEILYLEQVFTNCMERDNTLYQKLVSSLSMQETQSLTTCFNYAKAQLQQQQ